jgi:P27 family predicted phage terminase small subunit
MGQRGPRPTPTAHLKARGSPRAKQATRHEPTPERGRPECPTWFNDEQRCCWERLVAQLDVAGVVTRIDGHSLVRYCVAWCRWIRAVAFIEKNGEVYVLKDDSGKAKCTQQWPQVAIAKSLSTELLKIEQEFGMTPSARSRINIDPSSTAGGGQARQTAKPKAFRLRIAG